VVFEFPLLSEITTVPPAVEVVAAKRVTVPLVELSVREVTPPATVGVLANELDEYKRTPPVEVAVTTAESADLVTTKRSAVPVVLLPLASLPTRTTLLDGTLIPKAEVAVSPFVAV
jgi:hypothetical protein